MVINIGIFYTDKSDEVRTIIETLRKTYGNKEKACVLLKTSRRTLYTRMAKYGIALDEGRDESKKKKNEISKNTEKRK